MPLIQFTAALRRFHPTLKEVAVEAQTVAGALVELEKQFPGLSAYLIDERGALRKHVNIFIGNELIKDKKSLSDALKPDDKIFILQALSGG